MIKVTTALAYGEKHPAYLSAKKLLKDTNKLGSTVVKSKSTTELKDNLTKKLFNTPEQEKQFNSDKNAITKAVGEKDSPDYKLKLNKLLKSYPNNMALHDIMSEDAPVDLLAHTINGTIKPNPKLIQKSLINSAEQELSNMKKDTNFKKNKKEKAIKIMDFVTKVSQKVSKNLNEDDIINLTNTINTISDYVSKETGVKNTKKEI